MTGNRLRRVAAPDGKEYWVGEVGQVEGIVRTGKEREDTKEHEERHLVEKLLDAWDWPLDATSIGRPKPPATYEFDCENLQTGERVAIEVKRMPTLSIERLKYLTAKGGNSWERVRREPMSFPDKRVKKANCQLANAPEGTERRCVLLAWDFEASEDDLEWDYLMASLDRIDIRSYTNVDEVWLATASLRMFYHLEFESLEQDK